MSKAYLCEGDRAFAGALFRSYQEAGIWSLDYLAVVTMLKTAGLSCDGYVRFVCRKLKKKNGKFPFPQQVFGLRAAKKWFTEYARKSNDVIDPVLYRSPAR